MSNKHRQDVDTWHAPRATRLRGYEHPEMPEAERKGLEEAAYLGAKPNLNPKRLKRTRLLDLTARVELTRGLKSGNWSPRRVWALLAEIERAIAVYQIAEQEAKRPVAALASELQKIGELLSPLKAKLAFDAVRQAIEAQRATLAERAEGVPSYDVVQAYVALLLRWVQSAQKIAPQKPQSPKQAFLIALWSVYVKHFEIRGPGNPGEGLAFGRLVRVVVRVVARAIRRGKKYGLSFPTHGTLMAEWKIVKRWARAPMQTQPRGSPELA